MVITIRKGKAELIIDDEYKGDYPKRMGSQADNKNIIEIVKELTESVIKLSNENEQ